MDFRKGLISLALAALAVLTSATGALAFDDNPDHVDWTKVESGNCLVTLKGWGFTACDKGDKNGIWRVGLIGDSHMRQYFGPLDILAQRYHWKIKYISKSACTVANHDLYPVGRLEPSCRSWNLRLDRYLASHPPFDLIINSNSAFDSQANKQMSRAFRATVQSQLRRGTKWLVISDNPKPQANFEACITKDPATAEHRCRLPYSKAMQPRDILPETIHALPGVTVADFRSVFCPHECPAYLDGIDVYRDFSHISSTFAERMLPYVDAVIPREFKNLSYLAHRSAVVTHAPEMSVSTLIGLGS